MPQRVYWDHSGYYWGPVQPNGLQYGPPRKVTTFEKLPEWAIKAICLIKAGDNGTADVGRMQGPNDFVVEDRFIASLFADPVDRMSPDKPSTDPPDGLVW